ncbi:MAG: M1 family peptidase [Bacteroidetes bacterium]|nr:MAG: M1 family peptidase [Bacteroidota bacterium]
MKKLFFLSLLLIFGSEAFSQHDFYNNANYQFTRADTLRGMLRPERTCFDVTFYDLNIKIDPEERSINGFVEMIYNIEEDFSTLQVDLYENMDILKITHDGQFLKYDREYNAVFVHFPEVQKKGGAGKIRIYYQGKPQVAVSPPWDGGFVWSTDRNLKPWIGVACEGDGASLWWPNKDHLSDEPDSMGINITIPAGLTCVSNGNLRAIVDKGDSQTFQWFVSYPINNYNVTLNIADYTHFSEKYISFDGEELDLDYYVLRYNLEKAQKHFKQVHQVLAAYERFFGKYPFWDDGFGMVETPYLGMEHQGAIAYGNQFKRGYLGGMIPRDMDWDYIIVHEIAHEYFGNSISCNDLCEMWIHESFATYMEGLYVEYIHSYEDAVRYMRTKNFFLGNREPIIGPKGVNWENWEYSDHYGKGALVLHTLRHAINDDVQWFKLLRVFYQKYAISNITTEDFVNYVNDFTGEDYSAFFDQYLEHPALPELRYKIKEEGKNLVVEYKWYADVKDFNMPIKLGNPENYVMVRPNTQKWQKVELKKLSRKEFDIATELFLIETKKMR